MLRNKEFQDFILILIASFIVLIGLSLWLEPAATVWIVITAIILITASFLFTRWRYREIEKLSHYLHEIANGHDTMEIRDNVEGELSILKNNIYKMTMMLSEHKEKLQQDKIHLTNSISDISHQLKTPLTSMLMMVELLQHSQLPKAKREEFTHHIQVQLERMEWLISSLLKLSKMDAGTVVFKQENFPIKKLVDHAIKPMFIPMDIKEQKLQVVGDETALLQADFNWTAEALINILKNAVEHTDIGGTIQITFQDNTLFTELTVQDNGRGIAREDLPYLFKRFYRGKGASDSSVGIGLAMAHSIVTAQNGTIDVNSRVGEGTRFIMKFYKGVI